MTVQPGERWLADIRFTDASTSKIRQVLVLWLDALDAIVAAVTTAGPRLKPRRTAVGCFPRPKISGWAGL